MYDNWQKTNSFYLNVNLINISLIIDSRVDEWGNKWWKPNLFNEPVEKVKLDN